MITVAPKAAGTAVNANGAGPGHRPACSPKPAPLLLADEDRVAHTAAEL